MQMAHAPAATPGQSLWIAHSLIGFLTKGNYCKTPSIRAEQQRRTPCRCTPSKIQPPRELCKTPSPSASAWHCSGGNTRRLFSAIARLLLRKDNAVMGRSSDITRQTRWCKALLKADHQRSRIRSYVQLPIWRLAEGVKYTRSANA